MSRALRIKVVLPAHMQVQTECSVLESLTPEGFARENLMCVMLMVVAM